MDKLSEETFVSKKEQNKLFCSYNNASMEFDRPGEKESDYRFNIPSGNYLQSQVTVIIMSDCLKEQKKHWWIEPSNSCQKLNLSTL